MGAIVALEKDIIPIHESQVWNPNMRTNDPSEHVYKLFDEQYKFSYTKETDTINRLSAPTTQFRFAASQLGVSFYPYPMVVDLLKPHKIQEVWLELDSVNRPVKVYTSDHSYKNWTFFGGGNLINTQLRLTGDTDCRYVIFVAESGWFSGIEEAIILGYPLDGERPDIIEPEPIFNSTQRPWRQVVGTNTFTSDNAQNQLAYDGFRLYMRWFYSLNQYYQTYLGNNKPRQYKEGTINVTQGSNIVEVTDADFYRQNTKDGLQIRIFGAGTGGSDLDGLITEVFSPTQLLISVSASTTVENVQCIFGNPSATTKEYHTISIVAGSNVGTISDVNLMNYSRYRENTILVRGAGRGGDAPDWASEITSIVDSTRVQTWNSPHVTITGANGIVKGVNCNFTTSLEYMFEPTDSGFRYDTWLRNLKERDGFVSVCHYGSNRAQSHAWKISSDESSTYEFSCFPHDHDAVIYNYSPNDIYGRRNTSAPIYTATDTDGVVHDLTDPMSYRTFAEHGYQFAARYGATVVDDSKLKLRAGQPRVSGLNYVKYIELGNEWDAGWAGSFIWTPPACMAALLSALYDGHKGTLGDGYGIKTADPNIKISIFQFAEELESPWYLKQCIEWWDEHRGVGDYPLDYIGYHKYSNSAQAQTGDRVPWSPEEDDVYEKALYMRETFSKLFPGKEVMIGEFGYDTQVDGPQYAPVIGTMDAQATQAYWVLRSKLLYYAAGFQGIYDYMLVDPNTTPTETYSKYSNCGSTTTNGTRKHRWYVDYTAKNILGNCVGCSVERHGGKTSYWIMNFTDPVTGNIIKPVWMGTREDLKQSIQIDVPEGKVTAQLIKLENLRTEGNSSSVSIINGKVTIEASEAPVFLIFSDEQLTIPSELVDLRADNITETQIDIRWTNTNILAETITVERKLSGGNFAVIATLGGGDATYSDTDINHGTEYTYRIKATNSVGSSSYSDEIVLRSKRAFLYFIRDIKIGLYRLEDYLTTYPRPVDGWADFVTDQTGIANHTQLNLTPYNGASSGINMQVVGATRGISGGGQIPIGNFPREIQRYFFFADNRDITVRFFGLDDTKFYSFEFLCNRAYVSSGYNAWVYASGSTYVKNFAINGPFEISTIQPTNGEIEVRFSEFSVEDNVIVNAVIVKEYTEDLINTPPNTIAKAMLIGGGLRYDSIDIAEGTSSIILTGIESFDGEGNIESYEWVQHSGPETIIINPLQSETEVSLIGGVGIYEFELKVTDSEGLFTTDRVVVNVYELVDNNLGGKRRMIL